jgi:hypothetical protein
VRRHTSCAYSDTRVRRDGRHAYYRLHDHHVVDLLAAIRHHYEHANPPSPLTIPDPERHEVAR